MIKAIKDQGEQFDIKLVGDESAEYIATLYETLEQQVNEEEVKDRPEEAGIPNKLAVKTEKRRVIGKDIDYPILYVAEVKGGLAAYNEFGNRISDVKTTPEDRSKLVKTIANMNTTRWNHDRVDYNKK